MRWLLVVLLLPLVAPGAQPKSSAAPTCDEAFVTIDDWVQNHMAESPEVQAQMIARLDSLHDAHLGEDSDCRIGIGMDLMGLSSLTGESQISIKVSDELLAGRLLYDRPKELSRVYRDRSLALDNLGQSAEASRALVMASALVSRIPVAQGAAALRSLGNYTSDQGNWVVADDAFRRGLRLLEDSLPARPQWVRPRIGRFLVDYGMHLHNRSLLAMDAGHRHRLAREILAMSDTADVILGAHQTDNPTEAAYDQGQRALAVALSAYALSVLGHHGEAATKMKRAHSLATREAQVVFSYLLPVMWERQAETERMAGRLKPALASAQKYHAACRETEDVSCEAGSLEQMASIAEEDQDLQQAEQWYREAIALRDLDWERVRLQDWSTSRFASAQGPYRGLTRVLVRQERTAEAFTVLDGSRARSLRDLRASFALRDRLTPTRRDQVDSLLEELHSERYKLMGETLGTPEHAAATLHVSEMQSQLASETQQTGALPQALSVSQLQRTLYAQNRALVSYLVGDRETIAFVATGDTLVARSIPTTQLAIQRLMEQAGGPWQVSTPDAAVRLRPLHTLYQRLIEPLDDLLNEGVGLVIIPDGSLADVPFGMLVQNEAVAYDDAGYLVQQHPVSTDLAAALIVEDAGRPEAEFPLDLVAFGRGRFGEDGGRWRSRRGPILTNLPNVRNELASIQSRIGNHETALDRAATEQRFDAEAGQARIVHVASHAEADPTYPLYSRVYLWDDPESDDDGVVHLYELQDLRIPADLVVLSGCSTAAGQSQAGEGTIGLQYGVRAAGAHAALATLWPVDDKATVEIVGSFYEGLADGLPKDRALQKAQVAYLSHHTGGDASPYYWASAVLSGSPAPVPLSPPSPIWPWALGGAVLAAGVGGLVWRARHPATHASPSSS